MIKPLFLRDIPLDQAILEFQTALEKINRFGLLDSEEIPLDEGCLGRVLSHSIFAKRCAPHYHAAAMDGFAVDSRNTLNALPSRPVMLEVEGQAKYVDTGDAIPPWADAVIPIENIEGLDKEGRVIVGKRTQNPARIRIRAGTPPWAHIRPVGEDLITGQLIHSKGQKIRAVDLGAAAAGGNKTLLVARKPVVGIIPTGNELVTLEQDPKSGEITEFNSIMLAAQIQEWGGIPLRYPIVRDNIELLCAQIKEAVRSSDLVLVNAGSSAGSEDFTSTAIQQLGRVLVHGIAVRPGHPVILGIIDKIPGICKNETPIIGVPGYPVSAVMTLELFVRPIIRTWLGLYPEKGEEVDALLTRKITSPAGDDDFIRVVLGEVCGRLLAAPIARGAGVTSSLARADGVLVVPRMIQGIENGEKVRIRLLRDQKEFRNNLFTIGSHDLTLDILAEYLSRYGKRLVSSNVGSMGGLLALKRNETHFAGCHLLDPQSGTYNIADLQKWIPELKMVIMEWVRREQGLIVPKGNPKRIQGLLDLAGNEITFVNRQRGSGTRVLLDYQLQRFGIDEKGIKGYGDEEYTHLGVAVAVSSLRADCGLGIASAAAALDLDFVPLFEEQYQLIIPESLAFTSLLQPLFAIASDADFRKDVMKLPGYNLIHMGELLPTPDK
ncbi:MAG: molybdopterin biosynthesis protein [Chloroflexi bacterium]|nr:molybdopterin biosynthesis protein [Chloroflexota bacterium]